MKTFGNIVCFRNLEKATNDAIALFGDENASGIVLLKLFDDYYNGYEDNGRKIKGYEQLIAELIQKYPIDTEIIAEENLNHENTKKFIDCAFRDGELETSGMKIKTILPPTSRFSPAGNSHAEKKKTVITKLKAFFERFLGI
ncbi:MAG: hypothetical protein LBM13_06590 [Candidatus Ancillula sp.]|nr:hypothetical protein [Candidatus Ancillula sp.]